MVNSVYDNHLNHHADPLESTAETCQVCYVGLTQPTPAPA